MSELFSVFQHGNSPQGNSLTIENEIAAVPRYVRVYYRDPIGLHAKMDGSQRKACSVRSCFQRGIEQGR